LNLRKKQKKPGKIEFIIYLRSFRIFRSLGARGIYSLFILIMYVSLLLREEPTCFEHILCW
jgi:hypothetical protein